jgi:hypothetical protein
MEICNDLRGEKSVALKSPLAAPTITWSHEIIAQGHIEEGASTS